LRGDETCRVVLTQAASYAGVPGFALIWLLMLGGALIPAARTRTTTSRPSENRGVQDSAARRPTASWNARWEQSRPLER
jgi:hypothetical protein